MKKRSSLWQAVYSYTSVQDVIFQRVKKYYGYKVVSLLGVIREYDMEGERTIRIIRLEMYPNTRETDHIGLDIFYQANITDYIKRSTEFNQNLHKSYTVIWEFCNKQLQNMIDKNREYENKMHDNLIKVLQFMEIIMNEPEWLNYPFEWITGAFKRIVNMKQKDNKNLLYYSKCPKTS